MQRTTPGTSAGDLTAGQSVIVTQSVGGRSVEGVVISRSGRGYRVRVGRNDLRSPVVFFTKERNGWVGRVGGVEMVLSA